MKRTPKLLSLSALLLLFVAIVGVAEDDFPLQRDDPQIRSAVDYILSCQNLDGGFNNEPGADKSNLVATGNAAMALALTGDFDRAVKGGKTPLHYLTENWPDETASGGALGRYVMGLVAARGDPSDVAGTDYVARLKAKASTRGEETLFSEAYILLGLVAAGEAESSEAQDFVAYLIDKRYPDSGWGWGGGAPDLDTTGIVVCALLAAGEDPDSQMIKDAINYLKSQQNDDGGFLSSGMSADSNSICDNWAIMVLNAAGVDPTGWRKGSETPITHLLSCQQESGVFWWKPETQGSTGFLMEETAYGIIALLGEWIPVEAAPPGEEAEGATVTIHVLGDGAELFSGKVTVGSESFAKGGFDISNPTVLGALQETGTDYSLGDPASTGTPIVSDLAGSGTAIYFVNGARQDDPIGEYDLTGDECIVVSAPATVLPLRMTAPGEVVEALPFTIEVVSEDLDKDGNVVSKPAEGATVTVTSDTSSADYTTDEEGKIEIVLNEPGEYRVEAKKDGYISTIYLNCGYQIINCLSGETVEATIHVLSYGNPVFSGEVEVPAGKFLKDDVWIDYQTALGALQVTGVDYSIKDYGGGFIAVTALAGVNSWPAFYAQGSMAQLGLGSYGLTGGEWLTVSVPDIGTVPVLFMSAPSYVEVGTPFNITVEEEYMLPDWSIHRRASPGVKVIIEGVATYTTNVNGIASVTLNSAGEYKVKAEKSGCVGTYYIVPGGYHTITATGKVGELTVTKRASRGSAKPGEKLSYQIKICNDGDETLTDVNVTDVLQSGSTLSMVETWMGPVPETNPAPDEIIGNELKWNFSEIAPGECKEIILVVNVSEDRPSGYTLENCVSVVALEAQIAAMGCDEVFIGVRDPLIVTKTANKESVERGKKVKYTIKVCNNENTNMTDVEVKDVFSRDVEFVSADPSPMRSYSKDVRFSEIFWTFDSIEPDKCREITLEVIVPEMQDFEFDMELGVKGEGFVNVANDYSTTPPEYVLENNVYVSALNNTKSLVEASASADVAVTDPGTDLSTREHGSGIYEGDEVLRMRTEDKSISMEKDVSAEYGTTSLGLYNNRSVTYSSRWTEEACAKNRLKSTTMHESYRYATNIDRESQILLDDKGSSLAVESEFEGMGHIGLLQKSDPHALPDFESSDDYTGSFKVSQRAESSSIKYEKSAAGSGFAVADKRIGDEQRSYEHGTGLYESDEVIEAATNYIAKDISLVYQLMEISLTDEVSIEQTPKWKEGIWSKNASDGSVTFIGEEFSSLDRLEKETMARGLGDVATEAEFSGRARFRTIAQSGSWSSSDGLIYISGINLTEEWVKITNRGDESVNMAGWNLSDDDGHNYTFPAGFILNPGKSVKVHTFKGTDTSTDLYMGRDAPIWNDEGDCAILKDANGNLVDKRCTGIDLPYEIDIDDEYFGDYSIQRRVVFAGPSKYDEPHISISKSGEIFYEDERTLARYNISTENDGDRALGPLVIKDLVPPGSEFVNASERPSDISDESIEWTFINLGLGDSLDITLWLNVTDYQGDEVVNRVVASGGYNGGKVEASNFSAIEVDWLGCCEGGTISATKEGTFDPDEPNMVLYTLELENLDERTKAVRVTDFLPADMRFLNASIEPATIDGNVITWNLIDVGPEETVSITYRAEALRSGKFVNRAEVDARSVDGSATSVVYANAVVEVPKFEGEMEPSGWQPPDWGFKYKDYPNKLTCEEICNLEATTSGTSGAAKFEKVEEQDLGETTTTTTVTTSNLPSETAETRGSIAEALLNETSGNVESALGYLLTCQNEDGGFSPKPGEESKLGTTVFATIALASAGEDVASHKVAEMSPVEYLLENSDTLESSSSNPEAVTGRYVVALAAAGLDPHDISRTDYVEVLKGYSKPSGEIGKENYIWDDGWVILALAAAGEADSEEAERAAEYLESVQTDSGGWAWHGGEGGADPDTTGLIVCALMAAGVDPSADSVVKALSYFESEQNDDGGFSSLGSNSASGGWVIMALNAAGQNPKEWKKGSNDPISHLVSLQKEDGAIWWKENSEGTSLQWTAYGVVSMTGGTLPPNIL